MRILQINCAYKIGSTGKIVDSISSVLRSQGHDVFTCYGVGDNQYDNYSQKICNDLEHKINSLWARINGVQYGGLFLSNHTFATVIKKFRPDLVHVHCVNAYMINVYQLLKHLAHENIKTVVTLHAEFFHTGSCGHSYECEKWKTGCHHCSVYKTELNSWFFDRSSIAWKRMRNAFSDFKSGNIAITAVSPWLAKRAMLSPFLGKYNITYVPNGINISIFHHKSCIGLIDRKQYKKVVLFVTPSFSMSETDLKGGRFIPVVAQRQPNVKFIVVASRNDGKIGVMPTNVQLWGKAKSQEELAQLYSEADVTLLLSKRETFSMVTAESLCCGTPVVGFKAGGPESIVLREFARFVEYGNISALSEALDCCLSIGYEKKTISEKAKDAYSQENMCSLYYNVYNSLIKC